MPLVLMGEVQRKVKAVLFIAMLAGADVRVQQGASYATEQHMGQFANELANAGAKSAKQVAKQIDAMLADPSILHQAKRVAQQMEEFIALPSLQEHLRSFSEQIKASPEMNFEEQSNLFIQNMDSVQADPNFRVQSKRITAQMSAILADPDFLKQGNRAAERMEAVMADSSLQEQESGADDVVDAMVNKILTRSFETSPVQQVDLDTATAGKSSSLATQPRTGTGVQASMVPSIRAAYQAPARSAVSAKALFGLGQKQAAKEVPKKGKLSAPKKKLAKTAKPQPDGEDFEVPDDVQEFVNDAALLFARLAAASTMIHHGQEKIASAELFTKFAIDKYFAFLPEPHIFWTYSAAYVQFYAPFFLATGLFSRAAAAGLAGTMLGAFYYSAVSTGAEGFPLSLMADKVPVFHNYGYETPLLYLCVFVLVAASGPGKFSAAQLLGWNEDDTILGKIKQ